MASSRFPAITSIFFQLRLKAKERPSFFGEGDMKLFANLEFVKVVLKFVK